MPSGDQAAHQGPNRSCERSHRGLSRPLPDLRRFHKRIDLRRFNDALIARNTARLQEMHASRIGGYRFQMPKCVAYKIDGGGFFRQHLRAFGGQHDGNGGRRRDM